MSIADDCYELGRQCYDDDDYYHAVPWLEEALTKYEKEINKTVTLEEILSHLAFSTYKRGTKSIPVSWKLYIKWHSSISYNIP